MKFDKRKELYWIVAIVLLTCMAGSLLFGKALWRGEAIETQLHDTYFVLARTHVLGVIFLVFCALVYGGRAVRSSGSKAFKIVAVLMAASVLFAVMMVVIVTYRAGNYIDSKYQPAFDVKLGIPKENYFSAEYYPADRFIIRYDTVRLDSFSMVRIVATLNGSDSTEEYIGKHIWFRRLNGEAPLDLYMGSPGLEYGIWVPDPQPVAGTFMVVQELEYEGGIYLIPGDGPVAIVPGLHYALEGDVLYTKNGQIDSLQYQYNLKTHIGTDLQGKRIWRDNLNFSHDGYSIQ